MSYVFIFTLTFIDLLISDSSSSPLALLIHGDAAFTGQGVSLENVRLVHIKVLLMC